MFDDSIVEHGVDLFHAKLPHMIPRAIRLFCVLLFSLPLSAQTYTIGKIVFLQSGGFTQQQLETTAALQAGQKITPDDLSAAAQRLADTGYFDDVGASIEGSVSAATIKFADKPTPRDHMLHVGFENFVWLTHDEIEAAIKAKFPLFNDYLLDNSPHEAEIKEALKAALTAKSISAEVACDDFEPTLRHPRREIACRIAKPYIRVGSVKLGSVTPALVPLVQKSVNGVASLPYTEGPEDQTTADLILAPLLDAGYIQATLTNVAAIPIPPDERGVRVDLTAKLQPGDIYHCTGITFAGSPLLSADAFAASAKLHPGDIASRKALLETLTPLDAAYRRLGYMDIVIEAVPKFDETAHEVAYTVQFVPGEQYRVHEVTPNNLDPAALADFNRGFLMKSGELYNPEYVANFLKMNTALRALAGYSATFKAYADPGTHLVDVVITFVKGGMLTR